MQIKLLFENDKFIIVDLLKDSSIEGWARYHQNTRYFYGKREYPPINREPENINVFWEKIKDATYTIKKWGYQFPFLIPDKFDKEQSTLNLLHRFFTYNIIWSNDKTYYSKFTPNPFDNSFYLPEHVNEKQWLDAINEINGSVHFLEHHTKMTTGRRAILSILNRRMTTSHFYTDNKSWLDFENSQELNKNFLDFKDGIPVMLDDSILGKSILQSFADDDDPTCKDCTGRVGSYGGFYIDFDNDRKKIYTSKMFSKWLKNYNLDPYSVPYEFLIGRVADMSDIPTNHFHILQFIGIEWMLERS